MRGWTRLAKAGGSRAWLKRGVRVDGSFRFGDGRRWYAVKSQPRKEELACSQLQRQGFSAFLPKVARVVSRPTRTQTVHAPFFPGYLFVNLDLGAERWRSVNGTIGVISLVAFGDRPAPAPVGLIESLVALASDTGEVRFDESFRRGDRVRIIGGALNGHVGAFDGKGANERVFILLQILSRETRVEIARSAIMSA